MTITGERRREWAREYMKRRYLEDETGTAIRAAKCARSSRDIFLRKFERWVELIDFTHVGPLFPSGTGTPLNGNPRKGRPRKYVQ